MRFEDILDGSEEEHAAQEQHRQEMLAVIARLHEQGIIVSDHVLAVPVVLAGTLPTSEEFTLRCRYRKCRLTIGDTIVERTTKLDGTDFEEYEAGCLTPREAAEMLATLLGAAGYADAQRHALAAVS